MSSNKHSRGPRINSPATAEVDSVDYLRECAFAVEPSVVSLVESATMAGWSKKQILIAIMITADRYFQTSGLQFDPDHLDHIGSQEADLLN